MHAARPDRTTDSGPGRDVDAPPPAGLRAIGPFDPWASFTTACDVWAAGRTDAAGIARRARRRLRELLEAACASPLQARRLAAAAGVPAGDLLRSPLAAQRASRVPLEAIAPIGRAQAMAHFDEACTDRRVTRSGVDAFLADPARLGEAFLGCYAVWTSSGTTGEPGIWLHDARALAVYDALESLRMGGLERPGSGARLLDDWLRGPWGAGRRFAMVGATGGHFAGNASVERLRRIWPLAASNARTITIMQPVRSLCAELDAFDPAIVATYPTAAELLAEERAAGRLKARPQEIWLGGEQSSDTLRRQLAQAFGCRVREGYGASECMSIAWECDHGALHLNADWVILEPVDRAMRPVAPGTASHTVLLTNLANAVQPVIRHDLGDSVTLLPAPCPCGAPFPALRVEGRRDDVLEFDAADGSRTRLLPLALVTAMEDGAGAFDFQLLARDARTIALRLAPIEDTRTMRARCRRALRAHLDGQGLAHVAVVDEREPPHREPVSGKLRRVLRARPPG